MQIRELYLKNFGKFSDRTFLVREGVNVFYGENEFGKSTLFAFIKGMLFGMERARGRASKHDTFSRYQPWENPNYYAGVLRFESGGRNFRIERSFDKITKSASLICEDDGEELSIEHGDLDVLLDGMSAESFDNTIAIGQLGVQTNENLAVELKNYAANYYESGDGEIDVQYALEQLKVKQREIDAQIRRETLKKERMRSRIEQECEYVSRDCEKLRHDEQEVKRQLRREPEEQYLESDIEYEQYEPDDEIDEDAGWTDVDDAKLRHRRKFFLPALCIFLLGLATEGILLALSSKGGSEPMMRILMITAGILMAMSMLAFCIAKLHFVRQDQKQESERQLNRSERQRRERDRKQSAKGGRRSEQERLSWELGRIRANFHEKQVRLHNLQERLEELESVGFEVTQADEKRRAIALARETISQLSEEIVKGFGHSLNQKTSEIICAITDGKYEKLYIDEHMNLFLLTSQNRVPVENLSRGTIEQIYFALRMAAMDVLYREEFPVILDDTFVFYDDRRLESVLQWLATQKRQVIIFTCQKRELDILKKLEIPFGINE